VNKAVLKAREQKEREREKVKVLGEGWETV